MTLEADDVVSPSLTRVLLATVRLSARGERLTVRAVAREADLTVSWTHERLVALAGRGLVSWQPGRKGTLRPAVRPVAF